jgi:hypothetical protein
VRVLCRATIGSLRNARLLSDISSKELGADMVTTVYDRAVYLSRAVGARIGKPHAPEVAAQVERVVNYAQGAGSKWSNDAVRGTINSIVELLSATCYPPATAVARAIFDRKSGEPATDIELVLLAARARWDIELGFDVPIRWLAALAEVSVKTLRNLASIGQVSTQTKREGQVCTAAEAGRWLATRGVKVAVGSRRSTSGSRRQGIRAFDAG